MCAVCALKFSVEQIVRAENGRCAPIFNYTLNGRVGVRMSFGVAKHFIAKCSMCHTQCSSWQSSSAYIRIANPKITSLKSKFEWKIKLCIQDSRNKNAFHRLRRISDDPCSVRCISFFLLFFFFFYLWNVLTVGSRSQFFLSRLNGEHGEHIFFPRNLWRTTWRLHDALTRHCVPIISHRVKHIERQSNSVLFISSSACQQASSGQRMKWWRLCVCVRHSTFPFINASTWDN